MFTEIDRIISRNQGALFEYAAKQGYDMKKFVVQWMKSKVCKNYMDVSYSCLQFREPEEFMDYLEMDGEKFEIADLFHDGKIFDPATAFWMGRAYRMLFIKSGIKSKELVDIIPLERMLQYYPGMHTIEEENATEIMCEDAHIPKNKKSIYSQE